MKEKLAKSAITHQANIALSKMLEVLNKDPSLKIKKQNFLSWLIKEFEERHFRKSISKIKRENKDALMELQNLILQSKKARREGQEEPIELKRIKTLYRKVRNNLQTKNEK